MPRSVPRLSLALLVAGCTAGAPSVTDAPGGGSDARPVDARAIDAQPCWPGTPGIDYGRVKIGGEVVNLPDLGVGGGVGFLSIVGKTTGGACIADAEWCLHVSFDARVGEHTCTGNDRIEVDRLGVYFTADATRGSCSFTVNSLATSSGQIMYVTNVTANVLDLNTGTQSHAVTCGELRDTYP